MPPRLLTRRAFLHESVVGCAATEPHRLLDGQRVGSAFASHFKAAREGTTRPRLEDDCTLVALEVSPEP